MNKKARWQKISTGEGSGRAGVLHGAPRGPQMPDRGTMAWGGMQLPEQMNEYWGTVGKLPEGLPPCCYPPAVP